MVLWNIHTQPLLIWILNVLDTIQHRKQCEEFWISSSQGEPVGIGKWCTRRMKTGDRSIGVTPKEIDDIGSPPPCMRENEEQGLLV